MFILLDFNKGEEMAKLNFTGLGVKSEARSLFGCASDSAAFPLLHPPSHSVNLLRVGRLGRAGGTRGPGCQRGWPEALGIARFHSALGSGRWVGSYRQGDGVWVPSGKGFQALV